MNRIPLPLHSDDIAKIAERANQAKMELLKEYSLPFDHNVTDGDVRLVMEAIIEFQRGNKP